MIRATVVALSILACCDYVACDGRYTTSVLQVLAAIEHTFG
jgi:hypothetical protein